MPTATNITVKETLDLLDSKFSGISDGVSQGAYALWLGSGISRDRVIGLDGVLTKLLEFLRVRITQDPHCAFRRALEKIIGLAAPSTEQRSQIDFSRPCSEWLCVGDLLSRLWNQYSAVLSIEVDGQGLDYLLWTGLDFPKTFANQDPDAEHLAIAILALEQAVEQLATSNWDGLLEAAMRTLGRPLEFYRVTVTGEDLRGPAAAAILYKFHGCALRAIADETTYRPLLVARSAQIISWMASTKFKIVRDQLEALIQRSRTLMIGLSAQDTNIQNLFAQSGAQHGWKWDEPQTPIVFSAQELNNDQKTILNVAYGDDYEPNREAICDAARLPAYSKPLLLALVLATLTAKLEVLAKDASAPGLDANAQQRIVDGLMHLRNRAADAGNADRLGLVKAIALGLARARHQLQDGMSPSGPLPYYPLDEAPVHLMCGKQALAATGQRESASALGLIGLDDRAGHWTVSVDDPEDARSGALRLNRGSVSARVFFAANDDVITSLLECGALRADDSDAVVICSKRVTPRQHRSPAAKVRTGKVGPRYIAYGPMLANASDVASLCDALRAEVSI
ncbi:SIR2 family protein [Bradyrhizobium uaiense]|uniref:SIR2 family protein n=1 Tax=Bradyrhizobium uaiense TaxID=2594946 RepID=A0A6P1BFB7_9BRAD|nr:SIR2 family protein [Bradyrhizobium uaiense]NEU96929.1 SIR2 family protein [Bradyrhizobium uaiense]